jgi:hypothetical protein
MCCERASGVSHGARGHVKRGQRANLQKQANPFFKKRKTFYWPFKNKQTLFLKNAKHFSKKKSALQSHSSRPAPAESSKHPPPYVSNPLVNPTPSLTPPPRGGAPARAGARVSRFPTPPPKKKIPKKKRTERSSNLFWVGGRSSTGIRYVPAQSTEVPTWR